MAEIVVSSATGVMNSLLAKLSTLLLDEYKLQKRVKQDVRFLQEELSSIDALLLRLAKKEELNPQAKEWSSRVREMAYDIEDFIDIYMYKLQHEPEKSGGLKGFFRKNISKLKKLGSRHGVAEQIRELKVQIVETSERRKRYGLDASACSCDKNIQAIDPRLPALYKEAANLIGIDGPMDEIIKLVDDGKTQLNVVSIVGFGGLGKTTLANQVYQRIGQQFDCQAFVSVSQNPSITNVLRNILARIKGEEDATTGYKDGQWFIDEIRDFLKDKRYLIVIDDLWSIDAWQHIQCCLIDNSCGSRIILTTRVTDVATSCCSTYHGHVYEMRGLSEVDSKTLFFKGIFGYQKKYPSHLEEISIDIIRRCGGLPLVIITLSGLLKNKSYALDEWSTILKSIGSGLDEKDPKVEVMNKILSLSYNDLSYPLKKCFLYLSIYPEDYEIQMDDLVWKWIAEGFIQVNVEESLKEVGISYYKKLLNRRLIIPVEIGFNGQSYSCRVHDIVLDLIVRKALEDNFVTCITDHDYEYKLASQVKVRRLLLHLLGQDNATVASSDKAHVRSLILYCSRETMPSLLDFPVLRVLVVNCSWGLDSSYVKNIGQLFLLRYLKIQFGITQLPEDIGKLQALEVLDVFDTSIRELPTSIVELRKLKRLYGRHLKLPDGVGKMQALESLSIISVDKTTSEKILQELSSLTKLETLILHWVYGNNDMVAYKEALIPSISKLCNSSLRFLMLYLTHEYANLMWDSWSQPPHVLRELIFEWAIFSKIPAWMATLANLTLLQIAMNPLIQETIDILGSMPALTTLMLTDHSSDTNDNELLIFRSNTFQCLKVFRFGEDLTTNEEDITPAKTPLFEAGAMEMLGTLDLSIRAHWAQSAAAYGAPDLGIRHLPALWELTVGIDCTDATKEEVKAFEAAIRSAASNLPYRPTPVVNIRNELYMDDDDSSLEEDEIPTEMIEGIIRRLQAHRPSE